MLSFLDPVVRWAFHAIAWLDALLDPFLPLAAAGLAVVVFTAAIRLLLHPLARAQVRGERARSALAPQLKELRAQHGDDREKLATETMRLHQEAGVGIFAGLGPALLQMPVFSVLYRLFTTPNELLHHTFFGTALGAHVSFTPVWLCLLAGLAVTATFSARFAVAHAQETTGVMARLIRVLPYATTVFALFLPLAAALYLLTTTTWTVLERHYLHRKSPVTAGDPNRVP